MHRGKDKRSSDAAAAPNPLLDPVVPALRARALIAGVELGVFEAVGGGAATSEELARALGADRTGLERLLGLLVHTGYLERHGSRYGPTEVTRQTLLESSPARLSAWVRLGKFHWAVADRLEHVLRSGAPVDTDALLPSEQDRCAHQRAMADTARPAAPWVAERIPVRQGAVRMLDVGGSHGLYAAALCRLHPPMTAEILEPPRTLAAARRVAEEEGTTDVVRHREGDIRRLPADGRYDVVFLGNLVHHFSERENRGFLVDAFERLEPGGTVAVWDLRDARDSRESAPDASTTLETTGGLAAAVEAAFSLLFYLTSGSECYGRADLQGWMADAGLTGFEVHVPGAGSPHALYTARR